MYSPLEKSWNIFWIPFTYCGNGNTPGGDLANRAISSSLTKVLKSICGKLFTKKSFTSSKDFNVQILCDGRQITFAVLFALSWTDSNPRFILVVNVVPMLL